MRRALSMQYVRPTPSAVLLIAIAALLLEGCAGYVPGRYAYWDAKVREMCEKDGGVTVYERVRLSQNEFRLLGGIGTTLPVPRRESAESSRPYVADEQTTWLRDAKPSVFRSESLIVRVNDGKVLSRLVNYARVGEEIIPPYSCRDVGLRLDVVRQTFEIVETETK